jgi:hypothetical protein
MEKQAKEEWETLLPNQQEYIEVLLKQEKYDQTI